jgi:hypothetical protein
MDGWKQAPCGNFNYNFSPVCRKQRICMLFTAQGNVMMADGAEVAESSRNSVSDCGQCPKLSQFECYILLSGFFKTDSRCRSAWESQ